MTTHKIPYSSTSAVGMSAVFQAGEFTFSSETKQFKRHDGRTPGGVIVSAAEYTGPGSVSSKSDLINVADFGARQGINSAVAFDMAAAYAVAIGAARIGVNADYDITGAGQDIYRVQFVGRGSVSGKYKKRVMRDHDPAALPSQTLDADLHLPAFRAAHIPTVTLVGDSWMSGGYFGPGRADSQFEIITDYIKKRSGRQKINFVNRGVGGLRFTDLGRDAVVSISATAYPWATAATPYMDLVAATNPDLVIVSFGMNDSGGWDIGNFPQKDFWSVISKIRSFPSRPDIVFVTSGHKSISSLDTDYSSDERQRGTEAVAGYVKSMCELAGIGYLDIGRQMSILRDGQDTGDLYRKRYDYSGATIPFTAPVECHDYSIQIDCDSIDANFFTSKLEFPLSSLASKNFLFLENISNVLWVQAYRDSSGTFILKQNTGIATPVVGSDVKIYFQLLGSSCVLRMSTDGGNAWTTLYDAPIIRFGGTMLPTVKYTDAHVSQALDVYFCAGIPRDVRPGTNDGAMYSPDGGGNEINHPTPKFVRALFDPVCSAQRWGTVPWSPERGAFASQMLRGYDGLAIDFANKDMCIKSSANPEMNKVGLPQDILTWELGSAIDYVIDGTTGRVVGARFTGALPSILLSLLPFNAAEGTIIVEAKSLSAAGSGHAQLFAITQAGSTGPRIEGRLYDNATYLGSRVTMVNNSSATVADSGSGSTWPLVNGRFHRHGFSWKANQVVAICDGNYNCGAVDSSADIPTGLLKLRIGHLTTGAQSPGLIIRRLAYIPAALDQISLARMGLY